jgi:hypothetical protein
LAGSGREGQGQKELSTPGVGTIGVGNTGPASASARMNLDDMNERLDVARRKGAKKVKSMVGMLSSLLNQGPSPRASSDVADSASVQAHATYEDHYRSQGREKIGDRTSRDEVHDQAPGKFKGPRNGPHQTSASDLHGIAAGTQSSPSSVDSKIFSGLHIGDDNLLGIPGMGESARWNQSVPSLPAPPSPRSTREARAVVHDGQKDPVLAGLANSRLPAGHKIAKSLTRDDRLTSPHNDLVPSEPVSNANRFYAETKPPIIGDDDLLAGLSSARQNFRTAGDEVKFDEWGGFEMASPTPEPSGRAAEDLGTGLGIEGRGKSKKSSAGTGSLFDL